MKKRGKRIAAVFLAAAMTMLPVGTVYGEEIQNGAEPATDDPAARREQEREAGYKIPADTNSLEGWPEGDAQKRLEMLLSGMNGISPAEMAGILLRSAIEQRGGRIRDDMTVLCAGIWEKDREDAI